MSGRVIPLQDDPHRRVQAHLPWYAAGRLDDAETADIRAHLDGCPDCRAELEAERWLAVELAAAPPGTEPVDLDVEQGWSRLRRQVEQEARARAPLAGLTAWLGARRGGEARPARPAPPWLGWALGAQAALVLIMGGVAWRAAAPPPYHALGSPPATAPGNLVVIFRPDTTEAELRQALRASRARLVDGPTAADSYVLHVDPAGRAAALADLRARHAVVLAEPLDPVAIDGRPPE